MALAASGRGLWPRPLHVRWLFGLLPSQMGLCGALCASAGLSGSFVFPSLGGFLLKKSVGPFS